MWLLVIAGTIGVISPSGQEVGPFLPIEQAALSQVVPDRARTEVFAWYTMAGSVATALGALAGGFSDARAADVVGAGRQLSRGRHRATPALASSVRSCASRVSRAAEAAPTRRARAARRRSPALGHRQSRRRRAEAVGAVRAGFVRRRLRGPEFRRLLVLPAVRRRSRRRSGHLFFAANVFAGVSALVASRLADRIGLLNTMVVTHLPSNVLLILIPLMPTLPLAALMLLLRFSISQMDVPTQAVLHDGGRAAGGALGGVWHHRCRAHNRRRAEPVVCGPAVCPAVVDQRALLHRGHAEDRLRPAAVPRLPIAQTARRTHALGRHRGDTGHWRSVRVSAGRIALAPCRGHCRRPS